MTLEQEDQIIVFLWDSLKRDPEHKDRRQTGWGTYTKKGLLACLDRLNRAEDRDTCGSCLAGHHEQPKTCNCLCSCHLEGAA